MNSLSQILRYLENQKTFFEKNFNVSKIGVFGSYAKGLQKTESDLDIILEFYDGTENLYEIKQEIKKHIESSLNLKVDISREKYIKPIFKNKILSEAKYV